MHTVFLLLLLFEKETKKKNWGKKYQKAHIDQDQDQTTNKINYFIPPSAVLWIVYFSDFIQFP